MFKSIFVKLWLTFSLTLVTAIGAMLLVSHLLVKYQFLAFSLNSLEEQLPPIDQRICLNFLTNGSLNSYREDPMLWRKTIASTIFFHQPSDNTLLSINGDQPPAVQQTEVYQADSNQYNLKKDQLSFLRTLTLFDVKKDFVSGYKGKDVSWHYYPVLINKEPIAYIGFEKPRVLLRESEQLFISQQIKSFILISIASFFLALLIAMIVSRWMVKPVLQLSIGAKALAEGDFSVRVNVRSVDEFGTLCKNFNNMATWLETNERARRQWFADVSHEMRTPLAVLKAQIEAIQDGVRPANRSNIAILAQKLKSLQRLIDDLFELALSDLGALKFSKKKIKIRDLLSDFHTANYPRASDRGISFSLILPEEYGAEILADDRRMIQVFDNLLENSLRYTDAPGVVRWTLSADKNSAIISMQDSSPGVPDESLEKIFDRLYRVEKSRNRATGGTGLGLSLCRNIIDAHNGSITAEASTLDGLHIKIVLPEA